MDVSSAERAAWYMLLVNLYAKHVPLYAPDVLKEAVAAINQADKSGTEFDPDAEIGSALSGDGPSEFLPVSLLENNDSVTLETVGAIESPVSRSQARLSLLRTSLDRYQKAVKTKKSNASKKNSHGT